MTHGAHNHRTRRHTPTQNTVVGTLIWMTNPKDSHDTNILWPYGVLDCWTDRPTATSRIVISTLNRGRCYAAAAGSDDVAWRCLCSGARRSVAAAVVVTQYIGKYSSSARSIHRCCVMMWRLIAPQRLSFLGVSSPLRWSAASFCHVCRLVAGGGLPVWSSASIIIILLKLVLP